MHLICECCLFEVLIGDHDFFFFFLSVQTNTLAAEVLYSSVGDWAQLDRDSTVLDVCCGTGTIGISLAKVHARTHTRTHAHSLHSDK